MEFDFKRKYDGFFIVLLITLIFSIALSFANHTVIRDLDFANNINPNVYIYIYVLIWLNFVLINLAYFSVTKAEYSLTKDRIFIKKPLRKNIVLTYDKINKIVFNDKDKSFLIFGNLPSCTIIYTNKKSTKRIVMRTNRSELLYKIIHNEVVINKDSLKNSK